MHTMFDMRYNTINVEGKSYILTSQLRYKVKQSTDTPEYILQQLAVHLNFIGMEEGHIWIDIPIMEEKQYGNI